MSIKDLLSLADDKLKETFAKREYDPTKDRAKHVKAIEGDERSFGNPEPTKGRKAWKASNNVVEYTSRFPIGGKTTHYVPSERFSDFLERLKNLITEGHFDKDFETAAANGEAAPRASRAPRKPREGGSSGWSEERRAKFEATMAARKKG